VSVADQSRIRDIHAEFVDVSEQIAYQLAMLASLIDQTPSANDVSLLMFAKRVAATQERLRIEAERLRQGPPGQYVAIIQSVLQAQWGALRQLSGVVEHYVRFPSRSKSPGNLEARLAQISRELAVSARIAGSAGPSRDYIDAPASIEEEYEEELPRRGARLATLAKLAKLTSGFISACAALLIAYQSITLPAHQRKTTKGVDEAAPMDLPQPSAPAASASRVPARTVPVSEPPGTDASLVTPPSSPPPLPSAPAGTTLAGTAVDGISVTGMAMPPPHRSEPPATDPPSSASIGDPEKFVPVVFTHKDKETAERTFAKLQRQYPKVLAHRQGEVQSVDTSKGVFHRLVVLPPESREAATEICNRLALGGYEKCWVKNY
jgi:hypothetical protein